LVDWLIDVFFFKKKRKRKENEIKKLMILYTFLIEKRMDKNIERIKKKKI